MVKIIEFKIKSEYKVLSDKDGNKITGSIDESYTFITPCSYNTGVMVGSEKCSKCKFIKGREYSGNVVNISHDLDGPAKSKTIIIRSGEVFCSYSKQSKNIKSIW